MSALKPTRMLILPLALGVSMFATAQDTSSQGTASTDATTQSQSAKSASVAKTDQAFVKKAAQAGMTEIELGNLAQEKAQSQEVKQFAQKMVEDHRNANQELKSIAEQKNITLPTSLPAKEQKTKDRLSKLSGQEFDHAYMQHMLIDHKKAVANFKEASVTAKDNDIKQFAGKTLPTLQGHLDQAQQIAPKQTAELTGKDNKQNKEQQHEQHGQSATSDQQ